MSLPSHILPAFPPLGERTAIPFPGARPVPEAAPGYEERLHNLEVSHEAHHMELHGAHGEPGLGGKVWQLEHDYAELRQWVVYLAAFSVGVACAAALGVGLAVAPWLLP